jgi:hypothetical protein
LGLHGTQKTCAASGKSGQANYYRASTLRKRRGNEADVKAGNSAPVLPMATAVALKSPYEKFGVEAIRFSVEKRNASGSAPASTLVPTGFQKPQVTFHFGTHRYNLRRSFAWEKQLGRKVITAHRQHGEKSDEWQA